MATSFRVIMVELVTLTFFMHRSWLCFTTFIFVGKQGRDIICYSYSLQAFRLVQMADAGYHHYGNEIEMISQFFV